MVFRKRKGQAVVEYILLIAVIVIVGILLSTGYKRAIKVLWLYIGRQVTSPCAGCAPNETTSF